MKTLDSRSDVEAFLRGRWPKIEWVISEATREDPAGHTAAGWMVRRDTSSRGASLRAEAVATGTILQPGISEADAREAIWGKFMFVTSAHEAIQSGSRQLILVPADGEDLDLLKVGDELLFTPALSFPRAIVTHVVGLRNMTLGDLSPEDEEHLGVDFRTRWSNLHEVPWDPTFPVLRIEFKRPGSALSHAHE